MATVQCAAAGKCNGWARAARAPRAPSARRDARPALGSRAGRGQCARRAWADDGLERVPIGLDVEPPKRGVKHFLHLDDWSSDEVNGVLARAQEVKAKIKSGDRNFKPLEGKSMSMIFTKQSMRTRVSFETVTKTHLFDSA